MEMYLPACLGAAEGRCGLVSEVRACVDGSFLDFEAVVVCLALRLVVAGIWRLSVLL